MATFFPPGMIEGVYRNALTKFLQAALPKWVPGGNLQEWLDAVAAFSHTSRALHAGEQIATSIMSRINDGNARSWREAARHSNHSRWMYNRLQEELYGSVGMRYRSLITENAELIRNLPQEIASKVSQDIAKGAQQGLRPDALAKLLQGRFPQLSQGKINVISRTQVGVANTALTRARSEDIGLDWYEWFTSEDARVRRSHRNMNGVLVPWSEAPAPEALVNEKSTLGRYHAAQCPNCRCGPAPLLSVDDVSWPHRVYSGGSITRMTRAQFLRLAGAPGRRIAA